MNTFPEVSTAAHKDRDGHETAVRLAAIGVTRHAPLPPRGRVEVIRSPAESTAAQKDRDGHETAVKRG